MEYITLANGYKLPLLGYGTLHIPPKQTKECVLKALNTGYRLIDTAASYFNEKEIGEAIKESKMNRENIFLTTKVWVQDAGYEKTLEAFNQSLKNLGVDYIDLYLIHEPYGDYYGSWKALEELYLKGKVKAIGVCNFSPERLMDLYLNSEIHPMINQIEYHPFYQPKHQLCVMKQCDCKIEAWGPLNEGQRDIFNHPVLLEIAKKHKKTVSQIILRWHLDNQIIAIPKTAHLKRMKENMNIFDFKLDQEDQEKIEQLDLGYSEIIDHQNYMTAKWLNKCKIHD